VAAKPKGLHEVRTRVMCNPPLNNRQEEKAFFQVVEYLNELRHQVIGVGGYTYSETRPAAFHGFWWSDDGDAPVHDQIVLCTVDYLLPMGSRELSQQVTALKQTIRKWYRFYGSPQEEVWVVAHPIMRQT
jgi:hypothetical protein